MKKYQFTLHLGPEEYQQYYSGAVNAIQVTSHCGTTVRFQAKKMREFVLSNGIHGVFEMTLDDNNRFLAVKKIR